MEAIVVKKPGGYNRLEIERRESPQISHPTQVLVRVSHIGVNYADCLVRLGLYKSATDLDQYPIVPGFDFSGEVIAVGEAVDRFTVGDLVFGVTLFGAYQTELVVDQAYLRHKPQNMSLAVAASLPTAFLTAFYILRHAANIQKDERLLVRSVAGGVGSWLALLGTKIGAEVHGTVSTQEKKKVLSHRKDITVFLEGDLVHETTQYDVIANAKGGRSIRHDLQRLRPQGRLILYGFHGMVQTSRTGALSLWSWAKIAWEFYWTPRIHPFKLVNQNKSVHGFNLSYLFHRTDLYNRAMDELVQIIETEEILPEVEEVPFHSVAHAHQKLESGMTTGKLVLKV